MKKFFLIFNSIFLSLSLTLLLSCEAEQGATVITGEGSPSNPVQLSLNVAHNGQAANILNADSFYYINVTAGANYTVAVTDKSVPVALAVTNKSSFGTPYLYISDDYTDTDEETTQSPRLCEKYGLRGILLIAY